MTDQASISARTIEGLHAIAAAGHDIADALRETGRAEEGQIDVSVPAEQPRADSAGRGASGGALMGQTSAEALRAIEENVPQFVAALEASGFVISLGEKPETNENEDAS